ncbi:MAG: hypothetical protein SAJ37_11835 [Oscillatoria sp. PMC 1068.18]|nr:hypothetical protein [Oscillatoria sp. PMC 1076.18]MEC4989431.1 hypothetical protein [Oscillatoria sp. PMC 1068.18]
MTYRINPNWKIFCGFEINSQHILTALDQTHSILDLLPATLYRNIDYKTTSSIVGSIFCANLAITTNSIVNPIEKGHPDLIPQEGENSPEEILRNYPVGLEVKSTIGNVIKGAKIKAGNPRVQSLTSIT